MFEFLGVLIAFVGLLFALSSWMDKQPAIWKVEHATLNHIHVIRLVINTGTARRKFTRLWCPGFKAWQCPKKFVYTWGTHNDVPWDHFEAPCPLDWNLVEGKAEIHHVDFMLLPKKQTSTKQPKFVFITGTGCFVLVAKIPEAPKRSQ